MPKHKKKKISKYHLVLFLIIIAAFIFLASFLYIFTQATKLKTAQLKLDPFYTYLTPLISNDKPGTVLKKEKLNISVPGLKVAYRILYVTEGFDGTPRISSGSVFIPSAPAPVAGRPILSWAHGTLGMGDACAPSRSNPFNDMAWLSDALKRGWIVSATDYAGLGTEGINLYLIGTSEAHDVLNAARAAQQMDLNVSNSLVLFGHSQGGHSVLWSAHIVKAYAPDLKLIAVAAAAPAAKLSALIEEEYNKSVSWGIGPEIAVSWPLVYPQLDLQKTLSQGAYSTYKNLAQECLVGNPIGIKTRALIGKPFFKINPMSDPAWKNALAAQDAPYLSSQTPLIIAQGLKDEIVLPDTTALYAKNACASGSNLTMMWMGDVGHIPAAAISGPYVISWLDQRLQGIPVVSNCNQ